MEKMELYDYYNLCECVDRKKVINALKKIKPDWEVISNPYEFMIDLQILNHPKYVAIEIENGQ
jgi:hypothetical protein